MIARKVLGVEKPTSQKGIAHATYEKFEKLVSLFKSCFNTFSEASLQ